MRELRETSILLFISHCAKRIKNEIILEYIHLVLNGQRFAI